MILSWQHLLAFLFAVGLLVTVHEYGHFWVARRLGFKVLRFSIGFGPPLWLRRSGASELTDSDLLLGVVSRAEFVNRKLVLEPGDALVLFTDGVTEARDEEGIDLGSSLIAGALSNLHGSNADRLATAVNETVLNHVGDAENLDDDVTLLIVSREL